MGYEPVMSETKVEAIVIGGSAGALEAVETVLASLAADFPLPLALVLHIPPTKPSHLVDVLRAHCALAVKEAEDKEPLAAATLYVAPPNYHLLIERGRWFSLSVDEPVFFSRPSIDVLFESAADAYGPRLIGIVLSGANSDGASGLEAVHRAGGLTLVQQPETAIATAMPEAALRSTPSARSLTLPQISELLRGISLGRLEAASLEKWTPA